MTLILATSPQPAVSLGMVNHSRLVALAQDAGTIDFLQESLREAEGAMLDLVDAARESEEAAYDLEDAEDRHAMLSIALRAAFVLQVCGFVNETQAVALLKSTATLSR